MDDLSKNANFSKDLFALSKELKKAKYWDLANQLDRASSSILLNLAEGAAGKSLKDKKMFWKISKGSLFECVAILDLTQMIITVNQGQKSSLLNQMSEVGKMTSGLIRWADTQKQI